MENHNIIRNWLKKYNLPLNVFNIISRYLQPEEVPPAERSIKYKILDNLELEPVSNRRYTMMLENPDITQFIHILKPLFRNPSMYYHWVDNYLYQLDLYSGTNYDLIVGIEDTHLKIYFDFGDQIFGYKISGNVECRRYIRMKRRRFRPYLSKFRPILSRLDISYSDINHIYKKVTFGDHNNITWHLVLRNPKKNGLEYLAVIAIDNSCQYLTTYWKHESVYTSSMYRPSSASNLVRGISDIFSFLLT